MSLAAVPSASPLAESPPNELPSAELAPRFSADELAAFDRDGYFVLRGAVAPETVGVMRDATERGLRLPVEPVEYEADVRYPGAPPSRDADGGRTIRRLLQANGRDPVFTEFVSSPPLVARLEQLLGERVVMPLAHHNCVMTKHPDFGSETHWHQDIRYWSFARPQLVNAWVALGRETPDNGCLQVIPGTHRMTFARERLDAALFLRPDLAENQPLIESRKFVELQPGDVLFFHCLTFHAAGRNHSRQTKFSAVFTFRGVSNPPKPGTRSAGMAELMLPSAG
jgi:phytanoyl-CoA hydroxylase